MVTILLVEDDENIRLLTYSYLKSQYNVLTAKDGKEALDIIYSKKIDLMITDIMMPNMDGYELVKTIRDCGYEFPVILLTAKQSFDDKRRGFSLGTDDYLTKPFHQEELKWRIESLLRRANINTSKQIKINNLVVNSKTYTVQKDDNVVTLTKKEFDLLYKLLSYPNVIFTKNQLLDDVWGYDSDTSEDTIKTHINRLRHKINDFEELKITTVKGLGYKMVVDNG